MNRTELALLLFGQYTMEVMHAQKAPIFCQALAEPPQGVGAAAVQGTR